MKIPKKIKIGGHIYKVSLVKDLNNDGDLSTKHQEIRICKELPQTEKEVTFIHEIFHALNACFNEGANHVILESIAQQFYQVLKDNKLLK